MGTYWLIYRGTSLRVRRGETTVGRSPYCSILVTNSLVSREHALLTLDGEGLFLEDLGSTNGTKVNGERLEGRRRLEKGDLIGVGSDELQVAVRGDHDDRADTGRQDPDAPPTPSPTGRMTSTIIDLVEALVESARGTSAEGSAREKICRSIDDLVESPLDRDEAQRVLTVATEVASWAEDGSLDDWLETTGTALGEHTTGQFEA